MIAVLLGVFIYSRIIISSYSKVVKRLYQMNFNSLETERKRISNDLHDQLGYKILIMNKSIENLKSNSLLANNEEIARIQSNLRLFQFDIRKILEAIHPRDLMDGKWHESIVNLASDLSIGNSMINVSIHTKRRPNDQHLHQSYRIVQEKLANIITHVSPKTVQLDISTERNCLVIEFVYAGKTTFAKYVNSTLLGIRGRGLSIINDRLRIVGGTNQITNKNGYTIDSIFIPL